MSRRSSSSPKKFRENEGIHLGSYTSSVTPKRAVTMALKNMTGIPEDNMNKSLYLKWENRTDKNFCYCDAKSGIECWVYLEKDRWQVIFYTNS